MKLQPQIDLLYEQLKAALDHYSNEERFMSLREIKQRYGVNLRVINGALKMLEEEKLIYRKRYHGIFVQSSHRKHFDSILLVSPDYPSDEINALNRILQKRVLEKYTFHFSQCIYPIGDFYRIPLEKADILLLFGDASPYTIHDLLQFTNCGKPIVFFNRKFEDLPFSFVNFNNIEGGILACKYLIEHGCRKLLTICSEAKKIDILERLMAFEMYAKTQGIQCNRLTCETVAGESANAHAFDFLTKYLEERKCNFDGIFVDCYGSAPGVFGALHDNGLRIPQDVSVISFHGFGENNYCRPQLTTVGCDIESFPALLFEQLQRIIKHEISTFELQLPMQINEYCSVKKMGS